MYIYNIIQYSNAVAFTYLPVVADYYHPSSSLAFSTISMEKVNCE